MNVVPFNSEIYLMELSGTDLIYLLEQSAAMVSGVLQQSGLTLVIDTKKEIGERVVSAIVNGQQVERENTYTIAVNAFIRSGGDGFTGFLKGTNVRSTSVVEREIVVDYIKKLQTIAPKVEGRIILQ
ncbi:Trifunctional nucleotide phosphoesterase protein YfkN precursor [compost metagenome]